MGGGGADEREMVDHLIVFADALGTKEHQRTAELSYDFLRRLKAAIQESGPRLTLAADLAPGFHFRWFSDNVSMGTPLASTDGLEFTMRTAAQLQLQFMLQGVFLRGAATIGLHHHSSVMDYGPALTSAAVMEEKEAVYPRILLSGELVDRIRSSADARALVVQDRTDGSAHLHFLGLLGRGAYRLAEQKIELARSAASTPSVKKKYDWLASYLNFARGRRVLKSPVTLDLCTLA